jgi:hypothetical protein
MKKFFSLSNRVALLCLFCLFVTFSAKAQTNDDNFIVSIISPASIKQDLVRSATDCGWLGTSDFGPDVTAELCGEVVWALPDSVACAPFPPNSLDGKIALVRRGTCGFSLKIYHAQQAGAKAVIVLNHYSGALDGPCETRIDAATLFGGMAGLDSASAVTIPAIFLQRQTGEAIDGALKAGQTVEVCFTFPDVNDPYVSAAYATPASQVDSLGVLSFVAFNRGTDTIFDMEIKAQITGPNNYNFTIENAVLPLPPGFNDLVFFDTYLPPSVPGKYDVVMTNNKFTQSRDTLRRSFAITEHTYAVDNGNISDLQLYNDESFQAGGLLYQTGALYFTGPDGGVATYSTFGIANVDSIFTGNPSADLVQVLLYDADSDEDGALNFQGGGFGDLADAVVAIGTYTMQGTETWDKLVDVPLEDFLISGVPPTLKPNHAYYISYIYDGTENGSGRCPAFTASTSEDYLVYDGNALTTPLYLQNTVYSGWSGYTLVNRLQLDGYVPGTAVKEPNRLDASKFSITPNPGNEFVNLNLDLAAVNKQVMVTIFTPNGQIVRSQNLSDFQSGQVRFEVKDVPSGTYLMWIRTEEGVTVQKVAICH